MEKLIELLNKYSKKKHNLDMRELNGELGQGFHYLNYGSSYSELLMISKKYEFIKRLVENEKIDREKMGRFKAERKNTQIIAIENKSDFYLSLLMLLSIQDEPIEYLISILK